MKFMTHRDIFFCVLVYKMVIVEKGKGILSLFNNSAYRFFRNY